MGIIENNFYKNQVTFKKNKHLLKARLGSSGFHLFDRKSGLNILFDEIKIDPSLWSEAPRFVSIALTNSCNLSCYFCYAPKFHSVLDFDKLIHWITELDSNGCLSIGLGGGEPTLYPKFIELCKFIYNNTNLSLTFTTHGQNFNQKLINCIKDYINFVRFSMDGMGSIYETIRKSSFQRLLKNIQLMSEFVPFGINYVVNESTIPYLDQTYELAQELGASEFLLLPQRGVNEISGIDIETKQKLIEWIQKNKGPIRLSISEGEIDENFINYSSFFESGVNAYVHIDASGYLKKSSFESKGVFIGNNSIIDTVKKLKQN